MHAKALLFAVLLATNPAQADPSQAKVGPEYEPLSHLPAESAGFVAVPWTYARTGGIPFRYCTRIEPKSFFNDEYCAQWGSDPTFVIRYFSGEKEASFTTVMPGRNEGSVLLGYKLPTKGAKR